MRARSAITSSPPASTSPEPPPAVPCAEGCRPCIHAIKPAAASICAGWKTLTLLFPIRVEGDTIGAAVGACAAIPIVCRHVAGEAVEALITAPALEVQIVDVRLSSSAPSAAADSTEAPVESIQRPGQPARVQRCRKRSER